MTIDLGVAVAERMAVILDQRRRNGWVAEAGMAIGIGGRSI